MSPRHQIIVFKWEFHEDQFTARGEGAARIAPPDSARLDLALEGGFASGQAFVFGNTVVAKVPLAARVVPPAALFWGALGHLAVPAGDTTVRVTGDTVRADVVRGDTTFRAAYTDGRLIRLERISGGRIVERVDRDTDGVVRYRQLAARRSLDLTVVRRSDASPFDAAIWPH
jgi:hypothetical protein